jgi:hypothetical protein
MIYSMSRVPSRYFKTYDTLLQFEIWFAVLCCLMMMLLFPNYVFFNNVNYLMTVLVMNSFLMQIASFNLHNKVYAASVYGGRDNSLGLTILVTVRMFVLFVLVLWCIYPNGALECVNKIGNFHYPTQIVALMCMDFLNSVIDMIICFAMPRKVQNKFEQRTTEALKSDQDSDVSSVDSNERMNVQPVNRR